MRYGRIIIAILSVCILMLAGCAEPAVIPPASSSSSSKAPTGIRLIGDEKITIEAGSEYIEQGAKSADGSEVTVSGTVDNKKVGNYIITYSAGKGDKAGKITRTVSVTDTTPPTVILNGKAKMYVSAEKLYKEPGVTVTDNSSALPEIITKRSETQNDSFTVTYIVTDASGNRTSVMRQVTIKDVVRPVISLTGGDDIYVELNGAYTEGGYKATDDLDGDITSLVSVSGTVDTKTAGTYNVVYSVKDSSGNIASATRVVRVFSQQSDNPNRVYLTFDDGPSNLTPKVLDILKANGVKATFFITNYSDGNRDIVKRIVNEGHTLAIHTYSHEYSVCYASANAYMDGLEKMHAKILADTGYDARIIRFPGGASNTVSKKYCPGVMTELSRRTVEAGYSYFDWNVDSTDASGNKVASSKIYSSVTGGLRKNRNNVVLMHDLGSKTTTVAALDDIIKYCKSNGYVCLPITLDTVPVRHSINN